MSEPDAPGPAQATEAGASVEGLVVRRFQTDCPRCRRGPWEVTRWGPGVSPGASADAPLTLRLDCRRCGYHVEQDTVCSRLAETYQVLRAALPGVRVVDWDDRFLDPHGLTHTLERACPQLSEPRVAPGQGDAGVGARRVPTTRLGPADPRWAACPRCPVCLADARDAVWVPDGGPAHAYYHRTWTCPWLDGWSQVRLVSRDRAQRTRHRMCDECKPGARTRRWEPAWGHPGY